VLETHYITLDTRGKNDIINITDDIRSIVKNSKISRGSVLVFVPGATGAISTIEYEPGLLIDFPETMENLIPEKKQYRHNETWHDGNGHSHLRATLVGPSMVVPVEKKELILGTWQQIVFLEFDNKPHQRKIAVQYQGE
jgi:secondary thiamine-phosphate synthase enzyme